MQILQATPDLDAAVAVTSKGFVKPITDDLVEDVRVHLVGDITLILENPVTGELGGYAVFQVRDELLFLHGMMLDPALQGNQHARELIHDAAQRSQATHLGLRTQSPIMWSAGKAICSTWVPAMGGLDPDGYKLSAMLKLATEVSGSPKALHRACYQGRLYGEKPVHRNPNIQSWWDRMCDFERGDAVICVGKLRA